MDALIFILDSAQYGGAFVCPFIPSEHARAWEDGFASTTMHGPPSMLWAPSSHQKTGACMGFASSARPVFNLFHRKGIRISLMVLLKGYERELGAFKGVCKLA